MASTKTVVKQLVTEVLAPRGWTAERDGWWRRFPDGWTGFETDVRRLTGWLADDAPPGAVELALHAGVGLDLVGPVVLYPWAPPARPDHGSLWPFKGTESRVFDPATGLVHVMGVVAGDDWSRGVPLAELTDELCAWAEALADERALRDHFLAEYRSAPDPGPHRLRPLAVLVRRHGPAELYEEVVEATVRRLDEAGADHPGGPDAVAAMPDPSAFDGARFRRWLETQPPRA